MEAVKNIEKSLENIFKDLPHLPESTRKGLANIWPWLVLIGGLVQLWAALTLYRLANYTDGLYDLANSLSAIYGVGQVGPSGFDRTVIYLGVVVLVVEAILLLMAFPKLKNRAKQGWNLIFLVALINVAYSVLQIFTYGRGFGSFIFSLIGSAISFYLLFEIRGQFGGGKSSKAPKATTSK